MYVGESGWGREERVGGQSPECPITLGLTLSHSPWVAFWEGMRAWVLGQSLWAPGHPYSPAYASVHLCLLRAPGIPGAEKQKRYLALRYTCSCTHTSPRHPTPPGSLIQIKSHAEPGASTAKPGDAQQPGHRTPPYSEGRGGARQMRPRLSVLSRPGPPQLPRRESQDDDSALVSPVLLLLLKPRPRPRGIQTPPQALSLSFPHPVLFTSHLSPSSRHGRKWLLKGLLASRHNP